jgi:endo-1,4-beta-xylanase
MEKSAKRNKDMKIFRIVGVIVLMIISISAMSYIEETHQPALKDVFEKHFLIGAAVNSSLVFNKDSQAAEIVEKHFNTITAENAMKWTRIHPEPNTYRFDQADRFVDFGQKNNMFIIGHTLIWHYQIPQWTFIDSSGKLLNRDAMLSRMKDHIFTVVGRYKGRVKGWDVVNEALSDEGALKKTGWLRTIGEDFIEKAFEFAHEADPDAELYYNDFSLETPAKRDAVVRLVRELQSKGLRIDGIGIQGHWGLDYPREADFDAFVDSVAGLGIKVMITELDVDVLPRSLEYMGADNAMRSNLRKELNPYPNGLPEEMQQKLADRYARIFSMFLRHPNVISRVTFWGICDKSSWLNNWPIRGRANYPLLFDRNYKPKPAFYAVVETIEGKK